MYQFDSRIRFSEIDEFGQLTVPGVINYFQDCSIFHSESIGRGVKFLKEEQKGWLLASWQVLINRRPLLGETVAVSTWPTEFNGIYGTRNFTMRTKDGEMLSYANSIWVYMDLAKGRPLKVDPEEAKAYGMEPALEMEYAPRKITGMKDLTEGECMPVRPHHLDTNHHVNNGQYVAMALEVLPRQTQVRQLRVDYKKSAVLGDVICPRVGQDADRTLVELCNEKGSPFAYVEFKEK